MNELFKDNRVDPIYYPQNSKTQKGTQNMNARTISELIPDIVANRKTSPTDRWILLILDEKIECIPNEDNQTAGFALLPITMNHVNKGLSGREWDRIINRIATYQRNFPNFYADNAIVNTTIKDETEPTEKKGPSGPEKAKEKDKDETKTTADAE